MTQSDANYSPFPENQETHDQETLEPNGGNIRPSKLIIEHWLMERRCTEENFSQMRPFFRFQSQVGDDFVGPAWMGQTPQAIRVLLGRAGGGAGTG